ncbi:hypothetical protein BC351_33975 [Paenibacillus ferrarius]|uniref:DUF2642 domain-containing protein n=1 Tax=Paenibacillus ferrarius TaxID=1469647 RepID=A0A1V4HE55_9BACL|nr:hypothetical protein [Paenibacillus ferrarius]OPH51990.1 hypothetical protein BC351_33975 [Paenibacillus ferrarius]
MFEMLINHKTEVSIRIGKDNIQGVITHYYQQFQLLKISNVLIPIELIEQIEVLEPASSTAGIPLENQPQRLGAHGRV